MGSKIRISQIFIHGVKWQAVGQTFVNIMKFVTMMILARLLVPQDFGLFGIVQIFLSVGSSIIRMSILPAVVQREKINDAFLFSANSLALIIGVIFSFLFFYSASPLSVFFNNNRLILIIKILSVQFIFDSLSLVPLAVLRKKVDYKSLFYIRSYSYILGYAFISILLAFLGFGVFSLVWGSIANSLLLFLISLNILKRNNFKFKFKLRINEIKKIIKFGSWTALTHVVNLGAVKGDYFIVGKFMGDFSLGIYSKAYYLMQFGSTSIIEVFSNVLFPVFSKIQNDKEKMKRFILGFIPLLSIVTFSITILIFFTAKSIVITILGSKWLPVVLPLKILILFGVFRGLYKVFDSVILALGKVKEQFFIHTIYMILIIGLSYTGIKWGLKGVSYGVGLSIFFVFIILFVFLCNLLNIKIYEFFLMLKPIFIYGFSFFIIFFIAKMSIIIDNHFFYLFLMIVLWFLILFFLVVIFRLRFFNEDFYFLIRITLYLYPGFIRNILMRFVDRDLIQ